MSVLIPPQPNLAAGERKEKGTKDKKEHCRTGNPAHSFDP